MDTSSDKWMIYGAYGYTGELVVAEALRRGMKPVLAGRDREKLESLGTKTGLETRAFDLHDDFVASLADVAVVLHCAGPFSKTSRPMVDACLASNTSYLDITGEISVFEAIMHRDAEAKQRGLALIPGVGFDVVPTDSLAARLGERMPDATHLDLAFSTRGGGISRGTLKTMIEGLGQGGAIRKDGRITPVPVAWDVREIPYESGPRMSMTIPWGDVSTAFHTTGIPNIRVYTATPPRTIRRLRRFRALLGLTNLSPVRWLLLKFADRQKGPDQAQREKAYVELWGEVWNDSGTKESMAMRSPEGYSFTAASAVLAVERVLSGTVTPGTSTPARAFGSGFMDEAAGVIESLSH